MSALVACALSALLAKGPAASPTPVATRTERQQPVWLSKALPEPEEIRKVCPKGVPGVPIFEAHLLPDGTVGEVKFIRGSGCKGCDKLLSQAVRGWTFKPMRDGGKPVSRWMTMSVTDLGGR